MNPLQSLLDLLMSQAEARPGLGQSEPVATFAGRVVGPGETNLLELLSRPPQESPDAEGMGGLAKAAMGAPALAAPVLRDIGLYRQAGAMLPHETVLRMIRTLGPEKATRAMNLMQHQARTALGESFPVFRGLTAADLEMIQGRNLPGAMAFSTDEGIASMFARGRGLPMIAAEATPEALLYTMPRRSAIGAIERELLMNPWMLKSAQAVDVGSVFPTSKPQNLIAKLMNEAVPSTFNVNEVNRLLQELLRHGPGTSP